MSVTGTNKKHVKFDDDFDNESTVKPTQATESTHSDSDDSDDDDAPEEEGLSVGKSSIEDEIRRREEVVKREQRELKERRRKNDAKFREQQQAKEAKTKSKEELPEEVPEELPEDFFEKLDQQELARPMDEIPKHINFNDIDSEQYLPEIKKQLNKKRQNTLKRLRATTLKKGSFNVTLLDASNSLSAMAPKREASIMNTKDKWLKRKAIKRK